MTETTRKIFTEGTETAQHAAMMLAARARVKALSPKFNENVGQEYIDAKLGYLRLVHSLPFTVNYFGLSRQRMGLTRGMKILDMGSSYCPDMVQISADMDNHGTLICIDPSTEAQELALETYMHLGFPRVNLRRRSERGQDLTLDDNSVDASRAISLLQHVEDPETILAQMARVTKPGQHIVTVGPDWTSLRLVMEDDRYDVGGLLFNDPESYGVLHPESGKVTADWMRMAGIPRVSTEIHQLHSELFVLADMAMGITSGFAKKVDAGEMGQDEADAIIQHTKDQFASGKAHMEFDFYLNDGIAPE